MSRPWNVGRADYEWLWVAQGIIMSGSMNEKKPGGDYEYIMSDMRLFFDVDYEWITRDFNFPLVVSMSDLPYVFTVAYPWKKNYLGCGRHNT